jgi:PAS domain S-box-containing protein
VVVEDLTHEKRFSGPELLTEHDVVSGVSVVLQGAAQPYGVLGAHTTQPRTFTEHEARFVQSVADLLGMTIERYLAEETLREREEMLRTVIEQMPSGLSIAEAPSGKLLLHNEEAVRLLGHPLLESEDYRGYERYGAIHEDGTPYAPEEYPIARALRGEAVYQETMHYRRGDDTRTVFAVNAAPVRNDAGEIVMAVSTFHDISEIKRYEQRLEVLNETLEQRVQERTRQVRALASSLTLAEQRERHRVAQILHDDLQQLLYGAQMQLILLKKELEAGEGDDAASQFEKVEEILERGVHVARTLAVDLSPPVLEGEGLTEAIQWLATQMEELHNLDVTVTVDGPLDIADEEMRVLLFQLLRELLFNVVKHTDVATAAVRLHQENQHLKIDVTDEGRGFDLDAVRGDEQMQNAGFGLFSVQERLGLFGGQLTIETAPGEGTTATIIVPADPPENKQD